MKFVAALLIVALTSSDAHAECAEAEKLRGDVGVLRTVLSIKDREHSAAVQAYEAALAAEREAAVKAIEKARAPAWWLVGSVALLAGLAGGYFIAKN